MRFMLLFLFIVMGCQSTSGDKTHASAQEIRLRLSSQLLEHYPGRSEKSLHGGEFNALIKLLPHPEHEGAMRLVPEYMKGTGRMSGQYSHRSDEGEQGLENRLLRSGLVLKPEGGAWSIAFQAQALMAQMDVESEGRASASMARVKQILLPALKAPGIGFREGEALRQPVRDNALVDSVHYRVLAVGEGWADVSLTASLNTKTQAMGLVRYSREDNWPLQARVAFYIPKNKHMHYVLQLAIDRDYNRQLDYYFAPYERRAVNREWLYDVWSETPEEDEATLRADYSQWQSDKLEQAVLRGGFEVKGDRVALRPQYQQAFVSLHPNNLHLEGEMPWVFEAFTSTYSDTEGMVDTLWVSPAGWGPKAGRLDEIETLSGKMQYKYEASLEMVDIALKPGRFTFGDLVLEVSQSGPNQWRFKLFDTPELFAAKSQSTGLRPLLVKERIKLARTSFAPAALPMVGEVPSWLGADDLLFLSQSVVEVIDITTVPGVEALLWAKTQHVPTEIKVEFQRKAVKK